jgi:hypothetical protein
LDDETTEKLLAKHYREVAADFARKMEGPDCPGYAALRRAAAGEALSPAAESHLVGCDACQRTRDLFRAEMAARPARRLRLAWLAAPAAALALLAGLLIFGGGSAETRAYDALARASRQADLQRAQAQVQAELADLLPAAVAVTRGERAPDLTAGDQPAGSAFLPTDPVEVRVENRLGFSSPYQVAIEGLAPISGLRATRCLAGPPPGGWSAGRHRWSWATGDGEPVGRGEFLVLSASAQRLVERAERDFRDEPLRLAAVDALMGLSERARSLVERQLPGLPPDEQVRQRARFHLPPSGPG